VSSGRRLFAINFARPSAVPPVNRPIIEPACDASVTLPDNAKAGETIRCCGQTYRLTFEFGAFAEEDV
jgi:hypothetical protein